MNTNRLKVHQRRMQSDMTRRAGSPFDAAASATIARDEKIQAQHICQPEFCGLGGMRNFYDRVGLMPTSTNADVCLIRSHIAYHSGSAAAERATIAPSRGHSYRINGETVVRITDHYDHRDGVAGWTS